MKTLITSALIATAALTGAASAASTAANATNIIESALPGTDLSALSTEQLVAVAGTLQNTDGGAAKKAGVTRALIKSLQFKAEQ
ncbi:hypothetical protein CEW88_12370 [Alloyangia pacifica]|uniref:Secreted protein n=1 Tax=Alloyangia pacifica TaxID=311180 RepID=A0A2U8HF59_9RHOB|nr:MULTISPECIES: hypothetical protein [Roseobacteraceae]AWI84408.1 hypothetical protein CEW88_12370 [Alloyangia pacifica]NDV50426.1 hypothetical protein [Salipiger sp. PrR003]NDW32610.1 hypothetical protein [Salipiger sp. PrR007]